MNPATPRPLRLRTTLAAALSVLLVLGGLALGSAPAAAAAPGDVTGATMNWGIKESFRNYLSGPAAHGGWAVAGGVTDAVPFGWSGGSGSASTASSTGSVAYPGSIRFTGHEGVGVPSGSFALDVTLSNFRLKQDAAGVATVIVDSVANSFAAPAVFVTSADVAFAEVNLAAATAASTATSVAFGAAPATLTAAGAAALGNFYPAGTALDPVTFSWPVEQAPIPTPTPTPTLSVSKATDLDPAGASITIVGKNIMTGFMNRHGAPGEAGVYAQIGYLDADWRPSKGAAPESRSNAYSKWVKDVAPSDSYLAWSDNGDGTADFTWTVQIDKATLDAVARPGATLAVFTSGAGGAVQAVNELAVPLAFAVPVVTTPLSPPTTPTPPPAPVEKPPAPAAKPVAAAAGSLTWGIKQSFRDYVTGPIARGSISTTGVGSSGGAFTFAQGAGGTFNGSTGTIHYTGTVRFSGHEGLLELRLGNPVIRVDSASRGTLLVNVNGGAQVPFASLSLGAASRAASDGAVRYSAATAALTAQGAAAFGFNGSQFYSAGAALDPLTFVIGSTATATPVGGGGTRTIASFVAVQQDDAVEESEATVETMAVTSTAAGCQVEEALLTWGFKDTFRSYVSGAIAHGEWTVADGAAYSTPEFSWDTGGGSIDLDSNEGVVEFPGSITFTGHGGVLNTTLSNPQWRFDDSQTATLLLDVSGTTQSGDEVSEPGVEFVSIDLSAAQVARDGGTLTVTDAPTTLLADGSRAFGTYEAGEEFDPITASFTVAGDCADGAEVPAEAPDDADATDPASGGWPMWLTVALVAAALILGAIGLTVVRRRKG